MKLQTIYNELSSVYNAMESRNDGIFKLLESIKESIKLETVKESNQKDRYKAANLVLKNKASKSRPILQRAYIRDGYQLFTDSWIGFKLLNHIPELETNEPEASYPTLEKLITCVNMDSFIDLRVETIKDEMRFSNGECAIQLHDGMTAFFESKNIKILLDVLGFKNDEMIRFRFKQSSTNGYCNYSLFYADRNGDEAVIIPLKKDNPANKE